MSRRRRPSPLDRGEVTERAVAGEAGRKAGEAAQDLGNMARAFMIDAIGPLLTPDRRAAVLALGAQCVHPIEVVIRLNPPRNVSFVAAGMVLARVDFDALQ
jgi:hypothetical protein